VFKEAISCLITYVNSDISIGRSSNNVFLFATNYQLCHDVLVEGAERTYIELISEVLG
jgi:hypothetical protein